METDKHYLAVGLFIIILSVAAAIFAVWIVGTGHRDDVTYRIHFAESVSGLSVGDPVKFHGVNVGTVKTIALDAVDPRLVQVDVRLRKDTPVKTDTKATLDFKGITGVVFVELDGGSPGAPALVASEGQDQPPEIPSQKGTLALILEMVPKILDKFSSLENQVKKVVTDVGATTSAIKEKPSLLLFGSPKEKAAPADRNAPRHR